MVSTMVFVVVRYIALSYSVVGVCFRRYVYIQSIWVDNVFGTWMSAGSSSKKSSWVIISNME